jgi:hypothetical protein
MRLRASLEELIEVVPIGEENAASSLMIWKRHGVWSRTTIKGKLNGLVRCGRIPRKLIHRGPGDLTMYFRVV